MSLINWKKQTKVRNHLKDLHATVAFISKKYDECEEERREREEVLKNIRENQLYNKSRKILSVAVE